MAPRRPWDDRWRQYPASRPLPAEDGIATSRQRGPMATTWWSQRFVTVLESFGLGGRMQRGRRYARQGQVLDLDVSAGLLVAQVQGSRRTPYLVRVTFPAADDRQWEAITASMTAAVGFVARLLGGEVPPDLEAVFAGAGVPLFPAAWGDLTATCSCPDWENPCKHIAAVLYVFADRLDADPWLVLVLRGRGRDELLGALAPAGRPPAAAARDGEVAPWWPFAPGPLPELGPAGPLAGAFAERPGAVLDGLEPLEVTVGDRPVGDLLRPLYDRITDAGA